MKKANEIKVTGKNGNTIIIRFKDKDDHETEKKIMSGLVEIYESRIDAKKLVQANVNI